MARPDGREPDQLRPVTLTRRWSIHPEGSVLVEFGNTRVLCTASVTEGVPRWRKGSGLGWVTAEVDMNVVCTGDGDFVEVQGTGEANVFRRDQLDALLDLGVRGCAELAAAQQKALIP